MTVQPYTIIDSVKVVDVAAARARLNREGCESSFVRNGAGQSFEVYRHPDGRVFAVHTAFGNKRKREPLLIFTVAEVRLAV